MPMHTRLIHGLIATVFAALLSACDSNSPPTDPEAAANPPQPPAPQIGSIVDVAVEAGDFTTLVAALQATGLDATLADESATFTVFAPTDAAFEVLGQDTIDALLADTDTLSDILLYHVVSGQAVDAETALTLAGQVVEMANGANVALTLRDGALFINNSEVVSTDIEASNGIIHVIDAVLAPPAPTVAAGTIAEVAIAAGNFTTLVTALQATGLDSVVADPEQTLTVFAPTDDAFAVLGDETITALLGDTDTLSNILLYHVITGTAVDSITATSLFGQTVEMANGDSVSITVEDGALKINDATVITADIVTDNGIIHVIDTVLTPPAPMQATGTIVDVAVSAGNFTTLVTALQATGLDATLADETATFTVFAPTDEAFAALGEDTINSLLGDTDTLSDILLYHVISGQAVDSTTASSLAGQTVEMANGDTVAISRVGDALKINDATVTTADIMTDNGIIHVIDAVLTPPAAMESPGTIVDVAVAAGDFTTLVAALEATGLDATLADASATFTVFAPTDTAFEALGQETIEALLADTDTLSDILLYHVISGQAVDADTAATLAGESVEMANGDTVAISLEGDALKINDSTVIMEDIITDNGIIHVIDAVLSPPAD
jgi:transforming growth factor-beta-induced protein